MKNFQKICSLMAIVVTLTFFQSCTKQEQGLESIQKYSIDEFNQSFFDGTIAHTMETAATIIFVDQDNNIMTNEMYWAMDPGEVEKTYDALMISLSDYKTLVKDEFATTEYLKVIPFGTENMYIHDPYADNEKRLSHTEIGKLFEEFSSKESENNIEKDGNARVICDNGANVCTGDMFFQWGNWWDLAPACTWDQNGSSGPGHISIVEQGCLNQPRLVDFHIWEAFYSWNSDGSINRRHVRHVKASTTWGWTSGMQCTNFWHNEYLDSNESHRGTMSAFNGDEHGKKYGFDIKHYWGRPDTYYCSLYAWEMYQEAPGWYIDLDGGSVVDPNDIGLYMFHSANFSHCDF